MKPVRTKSTRNFNASIQSAADKASNELKKVKRFVDPYADLSREISIMTSRDSHVRTH